MKSANFIDPAVLTHHINDQLNMTDKILTVHHLGHSQSERIVWLCEELELEYRLVKYDRRKDNRLAPPEYKALHPMGTAPVITDGELVLAESAAIIEYLAASYAGGKLTVTPGEPGYADFLYWFHFTNGTLQPGLMRIMVLSRVDPSAESGAAQFARQRLDLIVSTIDKRLAVSRYLTGPELTAADIMLVFSLTTMRSFYPIDLSPWPHVLAYLQRIGARPAYQRAMHKGDPDLTPMLGATP